jgi:hypothetical protein
VLIRLFRCDVETRGGMEWRYTHTPYIIDTHTIGGAPPGVEEQALVGHVCVYVCMYVYVYVCMYVYVCICMYVSMCVCMYVCMCVCMYICMYIYLLAWKYRHLLVSTTVPAATWSSFICTAQHSTAQHGIRKG